MAVVPQQLGHELQFNCWFTFAKLIYKRLTFDWYTKLNWCEHMDPSNVIVFMRTYQPHDNDFDHMIFYRGWQKNYSAIQCLLSRANIYLRKIILKDILALGLIWICRISIGHWFTMYSVFREKILVFICFWWVSAPVFWSDDGSSNLRYFCWMMLKYVKKHYLIDQWSNYGNQS